MGQRVVVVTGAGRGIGRAVCRRFARDGALIVAASRTVAELHETRAVVEQGGGHCDVRPTDVSASDDVTALIEGAAGRHGRIDVLVNCAGVAPKCEIEELDPALFDTLQAVNIHAVYQSCRSVWPIMRRGGGVIINISSMASLDPFPGLAAYGAAKAWVNAWTRGMADEGRAYGIAVFSVAPGAVDTRMLRDAFPDFPVAQALQPSEVADVVHALAQPACRYASGQTVFVRK